MRKMAGGSQPEHCFRVGEEDASLARPTVIEGHHRILPVVKLQLHKKNRRHLLDIRKQNDRRPRVLLEISAGNPASSPSPDRRILAARKGGQAVAKSQMKSQDNNYIDT
ncbi:unnamed protein product [Calypogeia fissa]